ncbi:MAG: SH3 domain-containing protein [Geminicoccaceae bacterium]|nr:SH3 domain-containing protein [Geminicoccaceae bacterium]
MTNAPFPRPTRRRPLLPLVLGAAFLLWAGHAHAQRVGESGLPIPRFVSLAGEAINVRSGPGKNYPIRWVYTRLGLPVKVVEEFDAWRKVEDQDGEQGWIHGSLLSRRRTVMVVAELASLHRTPAREARVLLKAERGVIGRLLDCNPTWCFLDVGGTRGWMERAGLWGVLPDEMNQ